MTARDAATRLAEGQPAVQHTSAYVQACHALGYQHPDLTAHDSQVRDWYDTEAGLDLRVLDNDTAELRAALNAIEEALWLQRGQLSQLAAAWTGSAADSATGFLQRHLDVAAEVARRVRAAADGCAALGDNLWRLIDDKVATAISVDDRSQAQRSAWLAAAHTVTTGAGDDSEAEELVRRQVTPYVDNDIRTDWLTAMRSTTTAVAGSYDVTIEALMSAPDMCFEVPGELGPSGQSVTDQLVAADATMRTLPQLSPPDVTPAAATVPAAASPPPPPTTQAPPPLSVSPLDNWPALPTEMAGPLGDAADLSTGAANPGGLGGLAGNIGGVVGKIVDGIGALVGSLADGFSNPAGLSDSGDPLLDDPLDADDPLDVDDLGDDADEDDDADDAEPVELNDDAGAETPAADPAAPDDVVDDPANQQVTAPPAEPPPADSPPAEAPPADAPPAEPPPEGKTPCEIAADELPQAGQ